MLSFRTCRETVTNKVNDNMKNHIKTILLLLPFVFVFFFVLLKGEFVHIYASLVVEDGVLENIQVIVYLLCAFVSLLFVIDFSKRGSWLYSLVYGILSLGFFFIGMEEMGWGYRLFNFVLPQYFTVNNIQTELSLHNLDSCRTFVNEFYIFAGLFGAFAWKLIPRRIQTIDNAGSRFFLPDWFLIGYFLPVFLLYLYITYVSGILVKLTGLNIFHVGYLSVDLPVSAYLIDFVDQEPAEFLFVFGFLFFLIVNKYRISKLKRFDIAISKKFMRSFAFSVIVLILPLHLLHDANLEKVFPYDRLEWGKTLYENGKFQESIQEYQKALAIDPLHAETYNNLGVAYLKLKHFSEAMKAFEKSLQLNPRNCIALYNYASCMYNKGNVEMAKDLYLQAISVYPYFVDAHINLGIIYMMRKQFTKSKYYFREVLQLDPENIKARQLIAELK